MEGVYPQAARRRADGDSYNNNCKLIDYAVQEKAILANLEKWSGIEEQIWHQKAGIDWLVIQIPSFSMLGLEEPSLV